MKDITNRYKMLRGYRVHYAPGWDCHGLPIEQKALASARADHRNMDPLDIRKKG
jgi:isoleucyl-tRNA synthetase